MRTKNKFTSGHSALEKTNVLMNFEMDAPGIPGVVIALEIQLTLRYGAPLPRPGGPPPRAHPAPLVCSRVPSHVCWLRRGGLCKCILGVLPCYIAG